MRPAALLGLALLAGCEPQRPAAAPDYRPEQAGTVDHALCLLGFSAVPLRRVATGHQLVDGLVNGRRASFILDSGANVSVVHGAAAERLGLSTRGAAPAGAIGLGGAMKARQAALERLEIGGIPIRQSRIMVSDLSQIVSLLGPLSGGEIAGIIGQDVMQEHRAVIDVARPILYLMREDRAPAPVPAATCAETAASDGSKR